MERLNERIKNLRNRTGMSQGALARAAGVTRPAVSKWESGDTENLKLVNIVRLCQIFHVTADELIGGELVHRPASASTQAACEPMPSTYFKAPHTAYRMPPHLEKACADLNEDGRRVVEIQIEVAIETAKRLHGSRHSEQQTANSSVTLLRDRTARIYNFPHRP